MKLKIYLSLLAMIGTATAGTSVPNVATLRALPSLVPGETYTLQGYTTPGDGGGGDFYWDSTFTGTNNGGTVFTTTASPGFTGALIRNYSGAINVKWFGATGKNLPADTNAIKNALVEAGAKHCRTFFPAGIYQINQTITIPNYTDIFGEGKGLGATTRTSLYFSGTGKCFSLAGNYTKISDLELANTPGPVDPDAIGIEITTTRTYFENLTIRGFGTGVANTRGSKTFDHHFTDVYFSGCKIGADFDTAQNIVFDACFFSSNDIGVKLNTCYQVAFQPGCAMQIFGHLPDTGFRGAETTTSHHIDAENCGSLTIRDSYFETSTLSDSQSDQTTARLKSIRGFVYEGNYGITSLRADQDPLINFDDDESYGVSIQNNTILKMGLNTYLVGTGSGSLVQHRFKVCNNAITPNAYEKDNTFVPQLWTGTSEPAGISYTSRSGFTYFSGDTLRIVGKINLHLKGSGSGAVSIGNLPFPMKTRMGGDAQIMGQLRITKMASKKTGLSVETQSAYDHLDLYDDTRTAVPLSSLSDISTIYFEIS